MIIFAFLPSAIAFWLSVILLAFGLYGLAGAALISCGALVLLALVAAFAQAEEVDRG